MSVLTKLIIKNKTRGIKRKEILNSAIKTAYRKGQEIYISKATPMLG